ncbi:hypothetical protein CO613_11565 [Lysobacteraceae bacterium NML07-0707]|nr:hypothetical protein CO613_11565 [Xanthomonadaceae bacterium NML07-0707]
MTQSDSDLSVLAVMALEWMPDAAPPHPALSQQQAGLLAERIGHDLALLVPEVTGLDLMVMGAHFDPAEALRAGWPLHRRLHELRLRAPGRNAAPRIIALGADAAGEIPQPLQAEAAMQGGALRIVPLLLAGENAAAVGEQLETLLLERGMARAETALLAQEAFATRVEHVRYLTIHDLAAMMALQYRNMGLEPLWGLIETALLAPGKAAWLDAPPEPLLYLTNGEVRAGLFSDAAWRERYGGDEQDPARLARLRGFFDARLRQFAAVLEAHDLPLLYVDIAAGCDAKTVLMEA